MANAFATSKTLFGLPNHMTLVQARGRLQNYSKGTLMAAQVLSYLIGNLLTTVVVLLSDISSYIYWLVGACWCYHLGQYWYTLVDITSYLIPQ